MKVAVGSSINGVNSGKENDVAQEYVFQTWVFEFTVSFGSSPSYSKTIMGPKSALVK